MPSMAREAEGPGILIRVDSSPSCSSAEMDTRAHKPKQSLKPRRGIYFNEDVYVQETHHINDFTDEEVFHYWFEKKDYQQMKSDFAATVRLISLRRLPEDSDVHCARGLEYRTREGAHRRKLNKLTALCAVLDEQERQRIDGSWCDLKLAQVYIRANSHCRQNAYHLALHDEEDVHGVIDSDEEDNDCDARRVELGAGIPTTLRRSRSAGSAPEREEPHTNGTERSRSQDSQKANRIRSFFKRSKDKSEGNTSPTNTGR